MRPRNEHVIRTAYALSETPNDYGEISPRIYGVYSPRLGDESRICTHSETWKLVKKSKSSAHELEASKAGAGVDLGPSGVPPSLGLVAITVRSPEKQSVLKAKKRTEKPLNLDNLDTLTRGQSRELLRRLREQSRKSVNVKTIKNRNAKEKGELILKIIDFTKSIGWQLSNHAIYRLAAGHVVDIEGENYWVDHRGEVRRYGPSYRDNVRSLFARLKVISGKYN